MLLAQKAHNLSRVIMPPRYNFLTAITSRAFSGHCLCGSGHETKELFSYWAKDGPDMKRAPARDLVRENHFHAACPEMFKLLGRHLASLLNRKSSPFCLDTGAPQDTSALFLDSDFVLITGKTDPSLWGPETVSDEQKPESALSLERLLSHWLVHTVKYGDSFYLLASK